MQKIFAAFYICAGNGEYRTLPGSEECTPPLSAPPPPLPRPLPELLQGQDIEPPDLLTGTKGNTRHCPAHIPLRAGGQGCSGGQPWTQQPELVQCLNGHTGGRDDDSDDDSKHENTGDADNEYLAIDGHT